LPLVLPLSGETASWEVLEDVVIMSRKQKATVRDVAALAGLSTATVSRAFDPAFAHLVSEESRQRVMAAAAQLNYTKNHVARSLKTRSTKTIAVIAPELANDFFMELTEAMERVFEQAGYTLLVASSSNSVKEEQKRLTLFAERLVDGIVVIPAGDVGEHLNQLGRQGMPLLLVDRLVEGCDLDAVLSENEAGARSLTEALVGDGYREIAFIGGDCTVSTARERLAGYRCAMEDAGLTIREELVRLGGLGIADGYRLMGELLEEQKLPEALVAVNLLVHLGIQRRLLEEQRKGRSLPPIAIAAFDETVYSAFLPLLRYVAVQDVAGLGERAARWILKKIDEARAAPLAGSINAKEPEIVRLPVTVMPVNRGSFKTQEVLKEQP